jgi:ribonuclease HI
LTTQGKTLLVYADGSCLGNPGPGGWGAVVVEPDGAMRELCGYDPATTNNRMELTGAIEGLRATPSGSIETLRSDSEYLIKTIKLGWKRNKNHDLWNALDAELGRRNVSLEWVRGHADDALNNRADELATGAARAGIAAGAKVAASSLETPWLAELVRQDASTGEPGRTNSAASVAEGESPSPKAAGSPLPLSATEQDIADRLTPALRAGEAIRRCLNCGRIFVAAAAASSRTRAARNNSYCALAECQLSMRLSGRPKAAS